MESHSSNSGHNITLGDDKKILADDGIVQTTSTGEEHLSASTALDPAAERRLVWKFDLRILPTLAIMYLFNALVSVQLFSFASRLVLSLSLSLFPPHSTSPLGT